MAEYVDAYYDIEITVGAQEGEAILSNVVGAQQQIEYGQNAIITFDITNNGGKDTLWWGICNNQTSEPCDDWRIAPTYYDFLADETQNFTATLTNLTEDFFGQLKAGHVKPD